MSEDAHDTPMNNVLRFEAKEDSMTVYKDGKVIANIPDDLGERLDLSHIKKGQMLGRMLDYVTLAALAVIIGLLVLVLLGTPGGQ